MLDTILTEEITSYKDLEEKVFRISMEIGRAIMQKILQEQAQILDETRDKSIYRNKGNRKTVIKTKLGEVEYERPMYLLNKEKQKETGKKCIYLLDQMLEINKFGKISENLVDVMISNITELSYRKSAENISNLTGQTITGMGVWNVIQTVGSQIQKYEKEKVEAHEKDNLACGTKISKTIYQEADGIMIYLQGKDRKQKIENFKKQYPDIEVPKCIRNIELRLGMTYEAWKKVGTNRYELTGKEYVAGFMSGEDMSKITNANLHSKYNMNQVEIRVLNGDGANWITRLASYDTIQQVDAYHVRSKIYERVRDRSDADILIEMFWKRQYAKMLEYIEELKYKYDGEEIEVEKLDRLKQFLSRRKHQLSRYKNYPGIKKKLEKMKKETGLSYRNMGVQESNNYCKITRRFKRRRMSWSIRGANNLSKVIAMHSSESCTEIASRLDLKLLPTEMIESAEKYIKQIEENIKQVQEIKIKPKKTYTGKQATISQNYPNMLKMLKDKPFSEIIYT